VHHAQPVERRAGNGTSTEVLAVGPVGDSGRPDITRLQARTGDGHAEPDVHPGQQLLTNLVRCGFDPAWLNHETR
jgi:hypothetical protein